jgi:hypothetical protein
MLAWEDAVVKTEEQEEAKTGHMEAFIETERFELNVSTAHVTEEEKAEKIKAKTEKEKCINKAARFFRFFKNKFTKK